MSLKRISIILVIIMVGFWLAFHTINTNAGVKKDGTKVLYYDWTVNLSRPSI